MKNGLLSWPPNDSNVILGMLIIHDGDVVQTDMEVTVDDLRSACKEFNLHFGTIRAAVNHMTPEQHTMLIDAEKHRESLRSSE